MDMDTIDFYLKWGNYGILGTNAICGIILGNFGQFFGYFIALMWFLSFNKIKSLKNMYRDDYFEVITNNS